MKLHRRESKREELLNSMSALTVLGDRFERNKLVKGAVVATAVAALAVGSTAISSLRRRMEETS